MSAVVCIISWEIIALNNKEKINCREFEILETDALDHGISTISTNVF